MDGRHRTWKEEGPLLTSGSWIIAPNEGTFVVLHWFRGVQLDAGATFSAKVVADGLGTVREAKTYVAKREWEGRKAS